MESERRRVIRQYKRTPFRGRRPLSRLKRERSAEAEHVLSSVGGLLF